MEKDAEAWRQKGAEHRKQKDYAKALEAYNRAIALKPGFARIWHGKSLVYQAMGKYDEAIAVCSKAIELVPGAGQIPSEGLYYGNRAYSYNNMREFAKAIADCEKAIENGYEDAQDDAADAPKDYSNQISADLDRAIELDEEENEN